MFVMVDYVRKMTMKTSCKYGEHGSFEYLLFLFKSNSSCLVNAFKKRKAANPRCLAGVLLFQFVCLF